MIDNIFGALEDIYFTVLTDTNLDSDETSTISLDSDALTKTIKAFKDIAIHQPYMAKDNIKFHLLKIATHFLNYIMHEDDGIFSLSEQELLKDYLKNKLTRLQDNEQKEILETFKIQISLQHIKDYILNNALPYRSLDMILDKIIDHMKNDERYFRPLEQIYSMLIEVKS
jgi:flagellar biosynthesis component FlhA